MDNFTDKLAQRLSAQEMIKANAQAEANEMRRLQEQVAQYEAILEDIAASFLLKFVTPNWKLFIFN